jgi:hypothetical protein
MIKTINQKTFFLFFFIFIYNYSSYLKYLPLKELSKKISSFIKTNSKKFYNYGALLPSIKSLPIINYSSNKNLFYNNLYNQNYNSNNEKNNQNSYKFLEKYSNTEKIFFENNKQKIFSIFHEILHLLFANINDTDKYFFNLLDIIKSIKEDNIDNLEKFYTYIINNKDKIYLNRIFTPNENNKPFYKKEKTLGNNASGINYYEIKNKIKFFMNHIVNKDIGNFNKSKIFNDFLEYIENTINQIKKIENFEKSEFINVITLSMAPLIGKYYLIKDIPYNKNRIDIKETIDIIDESNSDIKETIEYIINNIENKFIKDSKLISKITNLLLEFFTLTNNPLRNLFTNGKNPKIEKLENILLDINNIKNSKENILEKYIIKEFKDNSNFVSKNENFNYVFNIKFKNIFDQILKEKQINSKSIEEIKSIEETIYKTLIIVMNKLNTEFNSFKILEIIMDCLLKHKSIKIIENYSQGNIFGLLLHNELKTIKELKQLNQLNTNKNKKYFFINEILNFFTNNFEDDFKDKEIQDLVNRAENNKSLSDNIKQSKIKTLFSSQKLLYNNKNSFTFEMLKKAIENKNNKYRGLFEFLDDNMLIIWQNKVNGAENIENLLNNNYIIKELLPKNLLNNLKNLSYKDNLLNNEYKTKIANDILYLKKLLKNNLLKNKLNSTEISKILEDNLLYLFDSDKQKSNSSAKNILNLLFENIDLFNNFYEQSKEKNINIINFLTNINNTTKEEKMNIYNFIYNFIIKYKNIKK